MYSSNQRTLRGAQPPALTDESVRGRGWTHGRMADRASSRAAAGLAAEGMGRGRGSGCKGASEWDRQGMGPGQAGGTHHGRCTGGGSCSMTPPFLPQTFTILLNPALRTLANKRMSAGACHLLDATAQSSTTSNSPVMHPTADPPSSTPWPPTMAPPPTHLHPLHTSG